MLLLILLPFYTLRADKQFSKSIQKSVAVLEAMTVDSFATRRNSMFGSPTRTSVSSDLPMDMALVVEKTAHLNRTLLMELADMVDCFDSFFLNTGITTFSPNSKISVSASADSTSKVVPFSVKLDPKEYVEAAQMLDEFIQKILEKYFEIIDELLKIPVSISCLKTMPLYSSHLISLLSLHHLSQLSFLGRSF